MSIRTYSELILLPSFNERFDYLNLHGQVGKTTFAAERYINQQFYSSKIWKEIRDHVILRDNGCDLGCAGYDIYEKILIHHMNPITVEDLDKNIDDVLNPEFLICTSFVTHNAIHYGDARYLNKQPIERKPGDTCPWK